MHPKCYFENIKGGNRCGDVDVNIRIILKWILKE
jgi:hypothetical protein